MSTIQKLTETLETDMFTDRLIELYGTHTDIQSTKDRYRKVLQAHGAHPLAAKYRESALFSTSGRTELGGNHTDHNRGKVIAASIQLDTIASASTIEIPSVTIVSPRGSPMSPSTSRTCQSGRKKKGQQMHWSGA